MLNRRVSWIFLGAAAANCAFQIAWFWRFRAHNITMDAINYIGLARHLLDGNFTASLHGYWSPLLTWLIAAGSLFTHDFTLLGRVITIASLIACLPLLYALAYRLWHSHLTASFTVLWFSTARGVIAGAVTTIQADFLFAVCTLTYFILLLDCLRKGTKLKWLLLGLVHAVAFTAKAIAMPWLSVTTVLAVLTSRVTSLRTKAVLLLLAFLAPCAMWVTWGEVLKTKYGVFMTGYQLKANLMRNLKRELTHYENGNPYDFVDVSYDEYTVVEEWPAIRQFKLMNPALVRVILKSESRNLPAAFKETAILLSPGGLLALLVGLVLLTRHRSSHSAETGTAWISVIGSAALLGAYGMLVFDGRYVWPITPILMAVASYFMAPGEAGTQDELRPTPFLRKASVGLLVASTIFFASYWASPFRTTDRDFEISCYRASALLKGAQPAVETFVSIGNGPYPDHGVGFEVGPYVAYLSGRHLLALNSALPETGQATQLASAVLSKKADAVLVWGLPGNRTYQAIVNQLRNSPGASLDQVITDPSMGEVGRVVFFSQR